MKSIMYCDSKDLFWSIFPKREAEGVGPVQHQEEMTERSCHQCLSVPERRMPRGWSQVLLSGAWQ